jgi:Na+/H+ antiporter NhaD/arsenite permease-like protein
MWATGVALLLGIFYVLDRRNYLRAPKRVRERLAEPADDWRFEGLGNVFFLAVILGSVFLQHPPFLREGLMLAAALGSWFTTRKSIHEANAFNFHPIREVAVLFIGIFATMLPALDWLKLNAGTFATPTPGMFYWASGSLSGVLDNAPTYLSFLSAAMGSLVNPEVVQQVQQLVQHGVDAAAAIGPHAEQVKTTLAALQTLHPDLLAARSVSLEQIQIACLLGDAHLSQAIMAVSVGSVFFGACTYIGNGPNFMVKSIADQQKAHTPGFLGYVFRYTLPFLMPVLAVVWLLFFRQK